MDFSSLNSLRQEPLTKSRLESHLLTLGSGFKTGGGGLNCGGRSEWGGETAFSHDSGWASADLNDVGVGGSFGGSAPDLLDCLIMEDIEERIQQIKTGAAKPTEMICLKNLVNLLNLQNEEPKVRCEVPAATVPTNMRAIIGTGGASNKISFYHNDLKRLLEQEAPLSFPGQMPPVTVKLLPPGHPPADRQRSHASQDNPDLSQASVALGSECLASTSHSYQSQQSSVRSTKSRKPSWDHSRDVSLRIGEGFYQLRLLQKERIYCEDLFKIYGVSSNKSAKTPRRSLDDRSLNDLLLAVQDEMAAIVIFVRSVDAELKKRNLIKPLYDSIEIWSSNHSQVMDHSRISKNGYYGSRELIEKIKNLNGCTRQMRTAIFAILPGHTK